MGTSAADFQNSRDLNPVERLQIRFAACLFAWMCHPVMSVRGRPAMKWFLEELAPQEQVAAESCEAAESSLEAMCRSDPELRQRLDEALRHAPLYLELSARAMPTFAQAARYEHAAWLFLAPDVASRVAERHLEAIGAQPDAMREFQQTLWRRAAAYETARGTDGTQAA